MLCEATRTTMMMMVEEASRRAAALERGLVTIGKRRRKREVCVFSLSLVSLFLIECARRVES